MPSCETSMTPSLGLALLARFWTACASRSPPGKVVQILRQPVFCANGLLTTLEMGNARIKPVDDLLQYESEVPLTCWKHPPPLGNVPMT